jgi:simple sugar transport system substrate-binding protein
VPYNSAGACDEAPDACIGVPFFNWGPSYLATVEAVQNAEFEAQWQWVPPDWDNLDNLHTTGIGWLNGGGLTGDAANGLQDFVNGMADGTINLFTGPLNFQDGSTFLADGEDATDFEIWYTERLLEGIEGSSR